MRIDLERVQAMALNESPAVQEFVAKVSTTYNHEVLEAIRLLELAGYTITLGKDEADQAE